MADPLLIKFMLAAENGAKLLDRASPFWYRHIDFRQLSMACGGSCILGQVYSDYFDGLHELGLTDSLAVTYGFQIRYEDWKNRPNAFPALRSYWVGEIAQRLTADQLR
ncbi:hypothetical protein AB0K16_21900 [Nonomuraea jabiensis]|uniref:hypothetical protein n=1 Tax=Nonomuraea jabiensis TaxID=882448 RepID=UPI00344435C8